MFAPNIFRSLPAGLSSAFAFIHCSIFTPHDLRCLRLITFPSKGYFGLSDLLCTTQCSVNNWVFFPSGDAALSIFRDIYLSQHLRLSSGFCTQRIVLLYTSNFISGSLIVPPHTSAPLPPLTDFYNEEASLGDNYDKT